MWQYISSFIFTTDTATTVTATTVTATTVTATTAPAQTTSSTLSASPTQTIPLTNDHRLLTELKEQYGESRTVHIDGLFTVRSKKEDDFIVGNRSQMRQLPSAFRHEWNDHDIGFVVAYVINDKVICVFSEPV